MAWPQYPFYSNSVRHLTSATNCLITLNCLIKQKTWRKVSKESDWANYHHIRPGKFIQFLTQFLPTIQYCQGVGMWVRNCIGWFLAAHCMTSSACSHFLIHASTAIHTWLLLIIVVSKLYIPLLHVSPQERDNYVSVGGAGVAN